jgi:hypothetical protein
MWQGQAPMYLYDTSFNYQQPTTTKAKWNATRRKIVRRGQEASVFTVLQVYMGVL